jgi:hypothetical protein
VGNQLQEIVVTTDDRIRLSSHGQREKLVVIHISGYAGGYTGILMPERQFNKFE